MGRQAPMSPVLRWSVRIVLGVLVLAVLALTFWACALTNLGDDALDDAEATARDSARRLAAELDFSMADTEISERVERLASYVVDTRHEQGKTVLTVLVRGVASSVPGPASVELCYEFVLLAEGDDDVSYREVPECPPVKPRTT